MTRSGRRPGQSGTKAAIAEAAGRQFGQRGFTDTTIRSVAEEAGVDPKLVMQFFGSKDGLFTASMRWPFDPAEEIPRVIGHDPSAIGLRLVRLFVTTWDADSGRNPIVALLRAATVRTAAERQLRDFLRHELLLPIVSALDADQPDLRTNLVATHLLGLGVTRYIVRFEPIASMTPQDVVSLLAPSVQSALTGKLPRHR